MRHGDRTPVREKFGDLVRLVAKKNLGTVSKLGPQSDLISTVGIEFHILGQPKCFFVNVFKGCFESKQGPFGFC